MTFPKFSLKLGLLVLLLGVLVGSTVFAQDGPAEDAADAAVNEAEERGAACLDQFSVFISDMLSSDDAKDFFQDLFERNRCQQDDIFAIDSKIESKMKQIRGLFFNSCASPELSTLQAEVRELKMEQYFIRHIVPVAEDATYKRDSDKLAEDFDAIKFALYFDMKERFVDDKAWLNDEELEEAMQGWLDSYDDRLEEYVSCSTSPWQEVAEKWKEFQEGVQELSEIAGPPQNSPPEPEEDSDTSDSGEKNGGGSSIFGFLKKMLVIRNTEVTPLRDPDELAAEAKESGETLTISELQYSTLYEGDRYKREQDKAEMLSRFDLLYSRGSADITKDLVTRLQELRAVIDTTTKEPLHGLAQSSKGIHSKQGKTSP